MSCGTRLRRIGLFDWEKQRITAFRAKFLGENKNLSDTIYTETTYIPISSGMKKACVRAKTNIEKLQKHMKFTF